MSLFTHILPAMQYNFYGDRRSGEELATMIKLAWVCIDVMSTERMTGKENGHRSNRLFSSSSTVTRPSCPKLVSTSSFDYVGTLDSL